MATITAHAEPTQTAAVEPVAPVADTQPAESDSLAPKFAQLAKKEKWIKKMLDDVNAQKKSIEADRTRYETDYVPKARIKDKFLDVALEAGLTHDQIANMLLNQANGVQVDPTISKMEAKIAELEAKLNKTSTTFEEKEKTQYDQAVAQIRSDADALLAQNLEDYQVLSKRSDASVLVTRYIEDTYKEEGRVLKVEEAATFIENELLEQALAMASLDKVQKRSGLMKAPLEQAKPLTNQQQPKTLTNTMTSSSKPLSSNDRRARAIAAFRGQPT